MISTTPDQSAPDGREAVEIDAAGSALRVKFRFDRVPPSSVRATVSGTDEELEVFEESFGTYVVAAAPPEATVALSYDPGIGRAFIDAVASERIKWKERSAPGGRGLGDLYAVVRGKLDRTVLSAGREASMIRQAQQMWLVMDLVTTAFQDGRVEDDSAYHIEEALGRIPVDFTELEKSHAEGLYGALLNRMRARRGAVNMVTEPALELGFGRVRFWRREAAMKASALMLAALETVADYDLVRTADGWVAPREV